LHEQSHVIDERMRDHARFVTLLEPAQMHVLNQIKRLTRAADTLLQRLEHEAIQGLPKKIISYPFILLFIRKKGGTRLRITSRFKTPTAAS
jgi:hypothetical protein